MDGELCALEYLDTAGEDEYMAMSGQWIDFAEAFMLVYSVDQEESLERAVQWREHVLRVKDAQAKDARARKNLRVPMVLVANKSDLREDVQRRGRCIFPRVRRTQRVAGPSSKARKRERNSQTELYSPAQTR